MSQLPLVQGEGDSREVIGTVEVDVRGATVVLKSATIDPESSIGQHLRFPHKSLSLLQEWVDADHNAYREASKRS